MLIYIEEILSEIASIKECAALMLEKHEQGRSAAELLLDSKLLEKRIEYLQSIFPDGCSVGGAGRHIFWLKHFLDKWSLLSSSETSQVCSASQHNSNMAKSNLEDIIQHDLSDAEKSVRDWANTLTYVDVDLRKEIKVLVKTGQFDSVIRKSFVILKTRLCKKYGISEEIDGAELVNKLFGSGSTHFPDMPQKEKQAYRDLFSGLFGLIRNRFAHNNVEVSLAEMDLAISSVNYCLRLVDDFKSISTEVAA